MLSFFSDYRPREDSPEGIGMIVSEPTEVEPYIGVLNRGIAYDPSAPEE